MENIKQKRKSLEEKFSSIVQQNLSSKNEFFMNLKNTPSKFVMSPSFLGELHFSYQAAMHATRVMVYFLPFLNSPGLRKRKLAIYIDDDGLVNGDTHHYQLTRAFEAAGAKLLISDEEFGDLPDLKKLVSDKICNFIENVELLYTQSMGAWCIVELLSNDWIHALCNSLSKHIPGLQNHAYFADCFDYNTEEKHGIEALELTIDRLIQQPNLENLTFTHAEKMAQAVRLIWDDLNDKLVKHTN